MPRRSGVWSLGDHSTRSPRTRQLELLRFVAGHDGLNVRRLASELGRDYKNVHTDVAELIELGLLERDADGHLAAPFDEIVIHAGIRDAD